MNNWNTNMHLRSDDGNEIITDTINIKRGIFQGDSLSPLLFCVALIPLTSELNATGFGYNISKNSPNVSHLFYMDDLKLYSKTEQQLQGALHVVKKFSDDIEMKFGLSKCAKATLKGGKLIKKENIEIDVATTIKDLQQDNTYKYLGVDESEGIQHSKMKEKIRKEYYRRTKLVLKSELSAKNKIDSINSIAVPVVQYSFGIIDWKASEIASLDRKTRKLLTMHKALHPRSDVDRLYVQRKHGGRGLIQLEASFKTAIVGLDCYLSLKDEVKLRMVERHENSKRKYSIVKIARKVKQEHGLEEVVIEQERTPSQNAKVLKKKLREKIEEKRIERWQEKPLHGQYLTNTQKPYVDQESTHLWLTSGDLKGETEGYIIAAQDQSLMTRNYQHNILHQGTDDLCRLCHRLKQSL
jgi:predicted RNA-binding protein with RPS1 domain